MLYMSLNTDIKAQIALNGHTKKSRLQQAHNGSECKEEQLRTTLFCSGWSPWWTTSLNKSSSSDLLGMQWLSGILKTVSDLFQSTDRFKWLVVSAPVQNPKIINLEWFITASSSKSSHRRNSCLELLLAKCQLIDYQNLFVWIQSS